VSATSPRQRLGNLLVNSARGYRVDLGLGQITDRNRPALGYTIEQVLGVDPAVMCVYLARSARILAEAYGRAARIMGQGQPALLAALSAYNTGTFSGAS
jgi:type IV secretion system protein VirB1